MDARVCYLGIDAVTFAPGEGPREPYAVGLGGIQPHKGVETAVEAVGAVPAPCRPPLLWIGNVANPGYEDYLQAQAAELGVELRTRSLVSDAELVDTLRRASVMIAEGGVRETITHGVNGLLVPDRDPAALGRAIEEILVQPKLARRLGEAGTEIVRARWTWDAAVERLERHLLSVIGKP